MMYVDYTWDLSSTCILLDPELDTKKLNWNHGDFWQIVEKDGRKMFQKVDPIVKFVLEGSEENK